MWPSSPLNSLGFISLLCCPFPHATSSGLRPSLFSSDPLPCYNLKYIFPMLFSGLTLSEACLVAGATVGFQEMLWVSKMCCAWRLLPRVSPKGQISPLCVLERPKQGVGCSLMCMVTTLFCAPPTQIVKQFLWPQKWDRLFWNLFPWGCFTLWVNHCNKSILTLVSRVTYRGLEEKFISSLWSLGTPMQANFSFFFETRSHVT
jgi:hypothetical protein